uniref:putative ubiquitin-conjugating enzyme E2 38 n=1 Tax=Erigeron canadensis TaxID=72917 RepID=UPI001CB90BA3|nr:putative ubiquitin-conjugating enzyme E2 38 [Erigeron canadensis]
MGLSATGICMPQQSKKRVFQGSSEFKAEVSNKMLKLKESIKDVIELDSEGSISGSYNGKEYMESSSNDDDYVSEDDEYAVFPSRYDSIDLSIRNESSVLPFLDSIKTKNDTTSVPSLPVMGRVGRKHKQIKSSGGSCSSTCPPLQLQKDAMKVRSFKRLIRLHKVSTSFNMQVGTGTSYFPDLQDVMNHEEISPMEDVKLDQDSENIQKSLNVAGSSTTIGLDYNDDVTRKFRKFKKFDLVEDFSDHHYSSLNLGIMQPSGRWTKKIQEEWRILKKDLPDMIYVRVYESRMDLLRAGIIGAEGTPYHDGLFFFDVYFPISYPHDPPKVYYHSGGLRINPNLYNDGKVCLSLLNTWTGAKDEKWTPGVSTMLQVLVSIQGMILNAKPYFNEPGLADYEGSDYGESRSMQYNERTLIYSLKTMVYSMKNPPKHFEDLVIGHFRDRARSILTTCRAYMKGVGVGCAVNGGKETGSVRFKNDVERYMKTLVGAFKEIGGEDLEEFMPPTKNLTQKIRAFFGI